MCICIHNFSLIWFSDLRYIYSHKLYSKSELMWKFLLLKSCGDKKMYLIHVTNQDNPDTDIKVQAHC